MGWEDAPIVTAAATAPARPAWERAPIVEPDTTGVSRYVRGNLARSGVQAAPATGFVDALSAGLQMSVSGLMARGKAPDMAITKGAGLAERTGASLGTMVGDIPAMIGGFVLGAGGGAPTGPGALVTGMAGAFALPEGLRATLMDSYEKGEFHDFGDFWDRSTDIIWKTVKGLVIGGATGGAGVVAKGALPVAAGAFTKAAVPTAAELTTMVTVGRALEGEVPQAQDFLDAAVLLGGVKASVATAGKLRQIYAKTGKPPIEVLAEAKGDPALAAELAAPDQALPATYQPLAAAETARAIVPGEKAAQVAASPFADIPQAVGEPAKPTHINYNYMNAAEDVKGAAAKLSEVYEADIQAQRRGTVNWEQTSTETAKILADTLGGTDTRLLMPREPGTAAGAAEILARKQLTIGAAEDMARTAKEYATLGERASPADTLNFLASIERAAMIQAEFLGARAEAGRAMNILKSTTQTAERAQQINDVIRMYGGKPDVLARMIGELDNPAAALKFAKEAVKATSWEKVVEAWKAGLLSGPVTHVANMMGNSMFMALRAPIDAVAAGIGKFTGSADRVTAMEPIARLLGNLQGTLDGLKLAGQVFKTGEEFGKVDQYRKAIEGTKGDVIRLPFRALASEDALFRTMNERGEAYSLATREATKEGHNPLTREFRERVTELVNNPTSKMQEAITEAGTRYTFNKELGEKGQAVQNMVKQWHLEWALPFVRTPANIFKELGRMTPAAPLVKEWRQDFAKGGAARDKAIAELVVGSSIMGAVASFAMDGLITGAGEPEAGKKRVQQAAGWQPYSVKIDDKYYSYQRLQPVGTLMGLAADMAEVWDHMTDEEMDKVPKMLSVAFANAVTNQTFLQGITNIVNAMSDPKRFGPRFIQQLAASTVPNIVAQPTAMADPYAREIDSILDAVRSRIPGQREQLLPKRDIFGQPVKSVERLAGITPVATKTESEDKVRTEAARLGVSVGDTPKKTNVARGTGKLGDVKLTPEQRDVFATVAGKLAHDVLTPLVNSPAWDLMPPLVQKRVYSKVFETANKAGAVAAIPLAERIRLSQEITQKIMTALEPE